jgi:predicted MFS family arabinose efflux permease
VFAAFSLALVVSAAVGPAAGRSIDSRGGRPVLMTTNLLFATGLTILGLAQNTFTLFAAWALIGVAMGSGLYEAGFSTLVRLYGHEARRAITGITLLAGFASTVGWPLSAWLEAHVGWRNACFAWAALHLVLGLPLNASLPHAAQSTSEDTTTDATARGTQADPAPSREMRRRENWTAALLAFVFAAAWFVSTAMAAHLPRLLQASGATLTAAVGAAALVGPAQVAGRLLEFGWLRRLHPLLSARLAALAHPLGAPHAGGLAAVFALMHGAGNGILTIAKGTLPLALFGARAYGERQGWLMMPARIAQAIAPFVFGLALDRWGEGALWMSASVAALAFVALLAVPSPRS